VNSVEILKAAIEKAVSNGYKIPMLEREVLTFNLDSRQYGKNHSITLWRNGLIMSHDFAKAFWPDADDWCCDEDNRTDHCSKEVWKWHLQRMVLEENPIEYLWKFI
jgi:hypothetical protein